MKGFLAMTEASLSWLLIQNISFLMNIWSNNYIIGLLYFHSLQQVANVQAKAEICR